MKVCWKRTEKYIYLLLLFTLITRRILSPLVSFASMYSLEKLIFQKETTLFRFFVSYRIYILFAKLNFPQGIAIFPLVPQVSNHSVIYDRGSKFVKNFQHLLMGLEMVRENRDDVYYRNEPKRKYGKGTARKAG